MFDALLDAVRAETSGERALESVRALARFHRVQASPGYDEAARWLADRLRAIGFIPEIESVPGDGRTRFLGQLMPEGWECDHALATLFEGDLRERLCDYAADKLSLVLRSDPARGRFPVVALEGGAESSDYEGQNVSGKVVLSGADLHRVHQLAVIEREAAGILHDGRRVLPPVRDRMDDPDARSYTSFWWGPDEPRGWGFVLTPRQGERLRERLRAGGALEVEIEIESRRFATGIPLVSAALPGSTEDEVLVVAHLCHPQPSANDNASGVAAALEAARVLAALTERGQVGPLGRGVRFLWVPELTGSYAWLARDPDRARRLIAGLNLDMVGQDQDRCGSTLLIERPPCFAASFAEELLGRIRAAAVDWVTTFSGAGHYSMTRMAEVPYSGGSDHAVLNDPAVGVPCPMLIQWPDRFYHSSHDTPDKCDPRSLALAARLAATYAGFLAAAGDPERLWLLEAVARSARRRLLGALDARDRARAVEHERLRASSALSSLARLGFKATALERARAELESFAAREIPVEVAVAPDSEAAPRRMRPRRHLAAPLHHHRHLIERYPDLPLEERERWRDLERSLGCETVLELAWFGCDGRRTLAEIAHLVWVETGRYEPQVIAELFRWTTRLGLVEESEEGEWSPKPHDTATR